MTFDKISNSRPLHTFQIKYLAFLFVPILPASSTSSPVHVSVTFICLKIKWSFPNLNPDFTEMLALEGNSKGIQITSLCLSEKPPVLPLDRFACCAAIFVLLTLISTYEALCAASASGHDIFQNTTVFFEHNKFLQSSGLITDFHWFVSRVGQRVLYKSV